MIKNNSISYNTFMRFMPFILAQEGGFSDDKNDSGGRTNFGILEREYRAYTGKPNANIEHISMDEVFAIYYNKYWLPSGADNLPEGLNVTHFDTAVNLGLSQAATCLKRTHRDGWSGKALAFAYLADRSAVYDKIVQAHPQDKAFIHGWDNRLAALKALVEKVTA